MEAQPSAKRGDAWSEGRIGRVLDRLPDAVLVLDEGLRIVHANAYALFILGRRLDEVLGESLWDLLPHLSDTEARREIQRAFESGEEARFIYHSALTGRWLEARVFREGDELVLHTTDLSAAKTAEADLRRTQESLGLAMRGSRMGWWRRDLLTGEVVWSPELEEIFGLEAGSFDGTRQTFLDFVHPGDRDRMASTVDRALAAGVDYLMEFRFRRADGSEGWMEGRGKAFLDDAGRPVASYGIGVDVTERREVEEALRRMGETFERLVQNSPFGIYVVDADFRLALVSQGAEKVFQKVRPLVGRDFGEVMRVLWEEPFASEVAAVFRRVLETGEPFHSPRTVETRSDVGEVESYDWRAERIAMPDGRFAAVCHFYDLSERLSYEASLRESEAMAQSVVDTVVEGVLVLAGDGEILLSNAAFARLHYGEDEAPYGRLQSFEPAFELFEPDGTPVLPEAWPAARALRGERVERRDLRVHRRDTDREFWGSYSAAPVLDEDGNVRLAVLSVADVTERMRADGELRDAKARTEGVLASADVATWVLDVRNDRVYADRNLARMFGADAAMANGGPSGEYVARMHPDDRERVAAALGRAMTDGAPYDVEYRIALGEEERWVTARGLPERDESGTIVRLPGVVVDVTQLKRAEERERKAAEALLESAERFRLLVESVPEIAWTARPDGHLDYYNERWYAYTGRQRGEEGDESWTPLLHPDDLDATYAAWSRSVETGEPYEIELRLREASTGEFRWFLARARPLRDAEGRTVRWFGVTSDIDDQKRIQHALSLANRLGVTLTQELDPERVVQALSDASTEAVGADFGSFFYARPEEERGADGGERFGLYVLSGAPREAFASFPPVRSTPLFTPTFSGEGPVRSDDVSKDPRFSGMPAGHLPVRSYLAMPVRGRDGSVLGGLLFGHAEPGRFTEEHQRLVESFAAQASVAYENAILYGRLREAKEDLERKVAERTADLQASNDALNGFMYHVAHDLRAPLRSIASTSRIVMEDFGDGLPQEAVGQLVRQAKAATRLGALIDDLLRLSRLSQQTVERAPIDLTALAWQVAEESLAAHPGTSVRVEVEEGMEAWADPRLLRLALGNLVENSVKYSPEGGTVLVGRHADGAHFVSDEGIGIDPRYFGKIFEPFQRLHGDEEFSGTGIGLSNVKQVMERHGGKIWVESELGNGSTFLFTLG